MQRVAKGGQTPGFSSDLRVKRRRFFGEKSEAGSFISNIVGSHGEHCRW